MGAFLTSKRLHFARTTRLAIGALSAAGFLALLLAAHPVCAAEADAEATTAGAIETTASLGVGMKDLSTSGGPVAPGMVGMQPGVPVPLAPAAPQGFRLSYSVVLATDPKLTLQSPENMSFATGTAYRLVVTPEINLYLYLIKEDAAKNYSLIHPGAGLNTSVDQLESAEFHPLPLAADAWYLVASTQGSERIHLFAAPHRIERLELLVEKAAAASKRGAALDNAVVKATLEAVEKEIGPGYVTTKRTETERSELELSGSPASRAVMSSIIELKVK